MDINYCGTCEYYIQTIDYIKYPDTTFSDDCKVHHWDLHLVNRAGMCKDFKYNKRNYIVNDEEFWK